MVNVKKTAAPGAASSREHPHLGVLFERGRRLATAAVLARYRAEGLDDLREGHGSAFIFMPPGGARLTDLARRARMTKQSMGELVRELESLGYLQRVPDPGDGRAKIVTFTPRGERANAIGIEAIRDMERGWERRVGTAQIRALRATLEEITRPET